jgi:hypothetical protein
LEKEKSTEKSKPLNALIRFSGFGIQLAAILGLAAWGGNKLDHYFELKFPLFLLVLLLSALGGTMYLFIRQVSKNN